MADERFIQIITPFRFAEQQFLKLINSLLGNKLLAAKLVQMQPGYSLIPCSHAPAWEQKDNEILYWNSTIDLVTSIINKNSLCDEAIFEKEEIRISEVKNLAESWLHILYHVFRRDWLTGCKVNENYCV